MTGASSRLPGSPDEEFVHDALPLEALFPPPLSGGPLEVEFGTGKARFLIESGRAHADRRYLGMERSLAYYRVARDRIALARVPNVRVVRADAGEAVRLLPERSADAFHAYFLDPWPKKRQRKRRLLGPAFLADAASRARPGALFRIVTDHSEYGEAIDAAIREAVAGGARWASLPWDAAAPPPPTHFELKYREAGRTFRRFLLRRS